MKTVGLSPICLRFSSVFLQNKSRSFIFYCFFKKTAKKFELRKKAAYHYFYLCRRNKKTGQVRVTSTHSLRQNITSTIIRFPVSQRSSSSVGRDGHRFYSGLLHKNKYRGRTVASGLSEMRSTGAYFLTVAIAGSNPACSTSFYKLRSRKAYFKNRRNAPLIHSLPITLLKKHNL